MLAALALSLFSAIFKLRFSYGAAYLVYGSLGPYCLAEYSMFALRGSSSFFLVWSLASDGSALFGWGLNGSGLSFILGYNLFY